MDILINELYTQTKVDLPKLSQVALKILRDLGRQERCELSIALVDDQEIQRLNREYRGIDRSTDVLAFAQQETADPQVVYPQSQNEVLPLVLGDVVISVETTQRQAQEYGHTLEQELYVLLLHGILHLLGYDHHADTDARMMEQLEQDILKTLDI